jgi:hypothetical protein
MHKDFDPKNCLNPLALVIHKKKVTESMRWVRPKLGKAVNALRVTHFIASGRLICNINQNSTAKNINWRIKTTEAGLKL